MKITKFGHSCLLVEEGGARILIDPGNYSTLQNEVKNLDAILITHEHSDHLDLDSLKIILAQNPQAKIYTHAGVGRKLAEGGVDFNLLGNGQTVAVGGVSVEGCGDKHSIIYGTFPDVVNLGYIINDKFLAPGDEFVAPKKSVEILALPICASWLKTAEAIDYAKAVKPKFVFPIHDGALSKRDSFYGRPSKELPAVGISWTLIADGETKEF